MKKNRQERKNNREQLLIIKVKIEGNNLEVYSEFKPKLNLINPNVNHPYIVKIYSEFLKLLEADGDIISYEVIKNQEIVKKEMDTAE